MIPSQQSGPQNVRPNPFGPAAADPVASAPDGTPTGKTPSGQNMVTINRNLSKEEVAELSVCEQFKDAFERECVPSWVSLFALLPWNHRPDADNDNVSG